MKKIFLLISFTTLMLQSCSSGDSDNNTNTTTVSDVDGNVYQTVTICNQTWTKTNLNVSKYRNGDVIPQVTNATQWLALNTGAWCYYQNNTANGTVYGKLYNWHAVNDPRGLAPLGYHIPTNDEWTILTDCLGGQSIAGGKMKETGTNHWQAPNTAATNESGFNGLSVGYLNNDGIFTNNGVSAHWWTSTALTATLAWTRTLEYNSGYAYDGYFRKYVGFSIRCIKD